MYGKADLSTSLFQCVRRVPDLPPELLIVDNRIDSTPNLAMELVIRDTPLEARLNRNEERINVCEARIIGVRNVKGS